MKKGVRIHCSATPEDQELTPKDLGEMHSKRGIRKPGGYHAYVRRNGDIIYLRDFTETGAHLYGRNKDTLGFCYEGGIIAGGDPNNPDHAADTRTPEQKASLAELIVAAVEWNVEQGYTEEIEVKGHRDESPDIDGDGIIEPWEWMKQCPCFDVEPEYKTLVRVATIASTTDPGQLPQDPRD